MTDTSTFKTHGVLSAATGILMGEIDALYEVGTFLLGRPIYTHELAFYSEAMKAVLSKAIPSIPLDVTTENWQQPRDAFLAHHGETIALPNALAGCLADNENPISTFSAMTTGA